jgi:protein-tyrosine phosphatase
MTKTIRIFFLFVNFVLAVASVTYSQKNESASGIYRAIIHRPDGNEIPFTMLVSTVNEKQVWIIRNADERIELKNISRVGDTLIATFPDI